MKQSNRFYPVQNVMMAMDLEGTPSASHH